jgi:hypothetical protein
VQPLCLDDILDLETYEQVRDAYRARIIAHKKSRRISVGPQLSLVFEDRETLRYQIQEMTRVERTTAPDKVQLEVDVYNELIPGPNELSATLFIEIPELDQIQPALDRLLGIDEHVAIVVRDADGNESVARARFDDRQMEEERISAVHYLRFSLSDEQARAFRSGPLPQLRIDHPHYHHEAVLSEPSRASLAADLDDRTPQLLDVARARAQGRSRPDLLSETDLVRVVRLSPPGASERIVVEPVASGASFESAEPKLWAELVSTAQRVASDLRARAGGARVRLDLLGHEPGALRFEIRAGS